MRIVIVGAGLAGGTAATALREAGHDGPITVIGAEDWAPYERPPLSKGFLLGQSPLDEAFVHEAGWYAAHDIDLRTGTRVTEIDREAKLVHTDDGDVSYDKLLLATGSEPRPFPLADEAGVPVSYLRTIADSETLKASFGEGRRVVIVGGGWIGLEVAAAARQAGSEVTLFEEAAQPLLRVLGADVAQRFADLHRQHGVDLRLGTSVTAADLQGADLVVAGVGVTPRVQLAQGAGLDVDNGVLVDAELRTSDPDIYAIGDIANEDHPTLGRLRVEHWDNAIEQGKVAAQNLAGGHVAYDRQPYFFTDQYDLGMEYFGHGSSDDEVVTSGDLGDGSGAFRAYWLRDGQLVAAMQANDWDASDELRDLVARGVDRSELPG